MRRYEFTCDWCGTVSCTPLGELPELWRIILVGLDEHKVSKWESKRHICPDCYVEPGTPLTITLARDNAPKAETPSE